MNGGALDKYMKKEEVGEENQFHFESGQYEVPVGHSEVTDHQAVRQHNWGLVRERSDRCYGFTSYLP